MNKNDYEKVEEYLNGEMSHQEKLLFEAELSSNEELLSAFKVYQTIETKMRTAEKYRVQENDLKDTLHFLNKEYFTPALQQEAKVVPLYSNTFFKVVTGIAASISIILVAYFSLLQSEENIQLLADSYFKENLQQIEQTVSDPDDTLQFGVAGNTRGKNTTQDSLLEGISAYNNQQYSKALLYFQGIYKNHPDNSEAKKNMGLAYLSIKEYEKALQQFDELANKKELENNPGLFLQAVTLMRRNQPGDKKEAKQLLQQIVETNAEGSTEAAQWLQKF
ncbi:tetratricopeptide repeat protein [Adhaeribacter radiodurans]|uniref:Tetratricopeptide repeat protein n=1 Tax=Adhaeribacter radiodurans TaxID=2745197 RepID=A0A7L7LCG6_9BACT|nr:hypothetical protein [Adhaeribacter radiodurans]QMU30542.1 hypothetical protein HUW48_22065 [Adhaeribacter radiodurans]